MVFLQLLKETGMRSGEELRLKWKDFDFVANNVRVNNPEKHGNPGIQKIPDKLVSMLKSMPQKFDMPFRGSVHGLRTNFTIQRKRTAENLKNPRLLNIHFPTFRHWKATMEYHRTKDILHIMRMLGHKSINSTLLDTQLVDFEGDEYDVKVAERKEEIIVLLEAGFEWVGQEKGLTISERESRTQKDAKFFKKALYFSDFAADFFHDLFCLRRINLDSEEALRRSQFEFHNFF